MMLLKLGSLDVNIEGAMCMESSLARRFLIAGLLLIATGAEAAQRPQPLPKIREFDMPTVERLGREIYAQDQLAWVATDVALAKRGGERGLTRDGMRGWITETQDGKNVVRFIRLGDKGPEALYDVIFSEGTEPTLTTPADRALREDELAQYSARMLALKNIQKPCSDRYNTVALKDPEGDGWLVWALASTNDADLVVLRGHYRFTVSGDGKTIRSTDALSTSCDQIRRRESAKNIPRGSEPAGVLSTHIVSLTPNETHVFASLNYKTLIHIGTNDGRTWRIDQDHVAAVDQGDAGIDGSAARFFAGFDEKCSVISSKADETPKRFYLSKGFTTVIQLTERSDKYSIVGDQGFHPESLVCGRKDIVPSPNDYKVLTAGLTLNISDLGVGHADRMGKLELINGKVRFSIIKGDSLTDELTTRVNARLESLQKAIDARQ